MGLKGYRLWDMGQLDSTCRAPPRPCRDGDGSRDIDADVADRIPAMSSSIYMISSAL
jgi:hypothetical protein